MADSVFIIYGIYAIASLFILWKAFQAGTPKLDHIPTVGYSGTFTSYIGGIRFLRRAKDVVQEGYDRFKGGVFKVAALDKWIVVVSNPKLIDELRKAPEDELSFDSAASDLVQIPFTLGRDFMQDRYHLPVIRGQLTHNIDVFFPDQRDEIVRSFEDLIPSDKHEWTTLPAFETATKIVTRVSNRIFVGLPLCRNEDYLELASKFAHEVMKLATTIKLFPRFMRPLVGDYICKQASSLKRGVQHLAPMIEEHLKWIDEDEDDSSGPDDMMSWLIRQAKPKNRTTRSVAQIILVINFEAIHTTSSSFTKALYYLGARPDIADVLREEVRDVVDREGWTKSAIDQMSKVDSFLKECQRCSPLGALTMVRKVVKPFTFSDGTFLPTGTTVAVPSYALHHDAELYEEPNVFDALRFCGEDNEEDEMVIKKDQLVTTGVTYVAFGHGRNACPGRFFAANELKALLAHTLIAYEVKLENEGGKPEDTWIADHSLPNTKARIMIRARQEE